MAKTLLEDAPVENDDLFLLGLLIENFKRIGLVTLEFEPGGGLIEFTGKNGQGKSSAIDAFLSALNWSEFHPDKPIKNGSKRSKVQLKLGNRSVELTVELTVTEGGKSLKVFDSAGKELGSPAGLVGGLTGAMIDPVKFLGLKPKEQINYMLEVTGLQAKADEIAARRSKTDSEYTVVNADKRRLTGLLDSLPAPSAGLPETPHDLSEIDNQIDALAGKHAEYAKLQNDITMAEREVQRSLDDIASVEQQLATLKQTLEQRKKNLEAVLVAAKAFTAPPDPSELRAQRQNLAAENEKLAASLQWKTVRAELSAKEQELDVLTDRKKALDGEKAALLSSGELGIDGLTFSEDSLFYNGVPLNDCSDSEKIRIAMQIAMQDQGKLKLVIIREGSLIDTDGKRLIHQIATEKGVRVIAEVVDSTGEYGIVFEEGAVKAVKKGSAEATDG